MAGHMGIESELVDTDYPTFIMYNKTWEKMNEDFYSIKGNIQKENPRE